MDAANFAFVIVNTLIPVATSPRVAAVTETCPAGADSLTVMLAVIEVAEFTVKLLINTLGKVSCVIPWTQLVLMPVIVTVRVAPTPAVEGDTLLITAGPGVT